MRIRKAELTDVESIINMSNEWTKRDEHPSFKPDTVRSVTRSVNKQYTIIAEEAGEPAGYLIASVYKAKKKEYYGLKKNQKYLYIHALYTRKEYRNKRLGSKLLKKTDEYAKTKKIKYIQLSGVSKNPGKLINFYTRNGFKTDKVLLHKNL